jgi:glyoxylate reductase
VLTETTADFAWALLLAAGRRVVEGDRQVHQGIWSSWGPDVLSGPDLYGATLGIIGFGRIGQAVARRAQGFHMRVIYTDPNPDQTTKTLPVEMVPLPVLLSQSDFITLHTFLSKDTFHLMDREQFEMMKPTAVLVNTSRGPVINPEALIWALKEKKIAGAALDVTEPEPIPTDSPLLQFENLIITPHIASSSFQTRRKMAVMAAENVVAALQNRPLPYCANPEVYKSLK